MAPVQKTQKAGKAAVFPKRTVCNAHDYLILLEYLEGEGNFVKLFGSGKKTAMGGKFLKRSNSWDVAAVELKAEGFQDTNGKNLYKKWQRYFSKYREAKRISNDTGGGLTGEELERGLTLEEKLNSMCDHFYKMDKLMGHRVNVEPPTTSGPMGFEEFGESFMQGNPSNDVSIGCINLDTPSPMEDQLDSPPLPSWVDEGGEGDQDGHQQEGVQERGHQKGQLEGVQEGGQWDSRKEDNRTTRQQEGGQQEGVHEGGQQSSKKKVGRKTVASTSVEKGQAKGVQKKDTPTLKPNLATIYQECKIQQAEFKYKAIERKEMWKMAEIQDKKDARMDDLKKRKWELEFEMEQKRDAKEDVSMEAHRERVHKVDDALCGFTALDHSASATWHELFPVILDRMLWRWRQYVFRYSNDFLCLGILQT